MPVLCVMCACASGSTRCIYTLERKQDLYSAYDCVCAHPHAYVQASVHAGVKVRIGE